MSKATKCDRCGGYFEQGGKAIRQGFGSDMAEFDLCPDCAEAFDAWMERGQMADATNKSNSQFDVLKTVETAKNATSKNEIHNFNDSREHLEADVLDYQGAWPLTDSTPIDVTWSVVRGWLDRQAAITERECMERSTSERIGFECAEGLGRELEARCYHLKARIAELQREIATLKEHRAANMEKLHELTDECAELRKYRDEWTGLAEKYRADSIAAQEETERYRAKLGDVLDALHEAERAAR